MTRPFARSPTRGAARGGVDARDRDAEAGDGDPREADLQSLDASLLDYPLVLKPSRSVGEHDGQRVALGVRHVADAERAARGDRRARRCRVSVARAAAHCRARASASFFSSGTERYVATFAHRRLREKPLRVASASTRRAWLPIRRSSSARGAARADAVERRRDGRVQARCEHGHRRI